MKTIIIISISVAFMFLCLCSCQSCGGEINENVWKQADKIEYSFHDSSLPPDYHRSYTIVVTPQTASISVTSYGTKLLNETYKVETEKFKSVVGSLRGLGIKQQKAKDVNPCSGGTAESLRLYAGTAKLFDGFQDNCEKRRGTMIVKNGNIPDVLNAAFPKSIDSIVDSTRRDFQEDDADYTAP